MKQSGYRDIVSDLDLSRGLADHQDDVLDDSHLRVVAMVQHWYRAMKHHQQNANPVYLPSGEWAVYLAEREDAMTVIERGDVEEAAVLLSNFWRNEFEAIVSQYAYFSDLNSGRKVDRFITLMARDIAVWKAMYHSQLSELPFPPVGNPWGVVYDNTLISPQSLRFHHQSRRLNQLLIGNSHPVVVEVGGGFGGMAGMSFEFLGNDATYIDFDLPETAALAGYFLLRSQPQNTRLALPGDGLTDVPGIVVAPNYMLDEIDSADVLHNAFSFSEMPFVTISMYMAHAERILPQWILHNNVDRRNVVNRGFERVPASDFPIPNGYVEAFRTFDLFQGPDGDYREFLYRLGAS